MNTIRDLMLKSCVTPQVLNVYLSRTLASRLERGSRRIHYFKHTSKRKLTKSHCMSMVDTVLMRSCARGAHGVCRQCPGLRRLALLVQACRGSASQHMRTRHDDEIDDNADVDAKDADDDDETLMTMMSTTTTTMMAIMATATPMATS